MKFVSLMAITQFILDIIMYLICCFRQKLFDSYDNQRSKRDKQDEDYFRQKVFNSYDCQKSKLEKHEEDYFRSYSDIAVHEEMLGDTVRTNAYRYAILKNFEKLRGKVVVDVGAGTGVLSIFCVQAGAKKVYAIEASDMAVQARRIVQENKMADRIDVVYNTVENVVFPEKVDVIVSEWMGYCLLYESMLPSVIRCRDMCLKEGGLMLPSTAALYMAPFEDVSYPNRLGFWTDIRTVYKLSMDCMQSYAQTCIARHVHVTSILPESVQAHAQQICSFDLRHVTLQDVYNVQKDFTFQCFGHTTIHGFVTWFTVGFPESVELTTSPYSEETHWSQTLFYLDEPCTVEQGCVIRGSISIRPHQDTPRFLDINLVYQCGNGPKHHKYYFMNDCIS